MRHARVSYVRQSNIHETESRNVAIDECGYICHLYLGNDMD